MRYAIGIDLGGTNIAAGVVDEQYHLLDTLSVPTLAERRWEQVAADMAGCVKSLAKKDGLSLSDCMGLGVGVPGAINGGKGEVIFSNNLHWSHVMLAGALSEQTGLTARLNNDANCAALGEVKAGAAKGHQNVILLTLGTGLGGGIIIDGKIYDGVEGVGGEIGHATLVMDGVPCTCGRRGCMEVYTSATALIRQTKEALAEHPESLLAKEERITGRSAYVAMSAGDETAKKVVEQYERYVGESIVNMVNIFRPEMVLLGGGISGEGKPLTDRLTAYVAKNCYAGDKTFVPPVKTAELGNKAGIVGAAALVI